MKYRIVFLGAALLAAAAACSGGQQNSSSSSTTTTTQAASSPAATAAAMKSSSSMSSAAMKGSSGHGAAVYNTNCSTCHQANGKGSPGAFPPLAGNAVVTGDPTKVIHIVKDGLTGAIKVNGQSYSGQMPAWKASLKAADIAAVVTYIRSSWGNHASAVTAAQVSAVK